MWHQPSRQKCKKGCLPTAKDPKVQVPIIIFVSFKPMIGKQSLLRGDRFEVGMSEEEVESNKWDIFRGERLAGSFPFVLCGVRE
jgi:hypothetical protein